MHTETERVRKLVESGHVFMDSLPDAAFSASHTYSRDCECWAWQSRLNQPAANGKSAGWIGAEDNRIGQYIQVDLQKIRKVFGIRIRGRADGKQWITRFLLKDSADGSNFRDLGLFDGVNDMNVTKNIFFTDAPRVARYIRLYPTNYYNHISLRWDVMFLDLLYDIVPLDISEASCEKAIKWMEDFQFFGGLTDKVKIMFAGASQSGKSSLLNTMITALRRKGMISNLFNAFASPDHVTTCFFDADMSQISERKIPLVIQESPGWERIDQFLMHALAKGNVGHLWEITEVLREINPKYNCRPTFRDQIHLIVLVVPSNEHDDPKYYSRKFNDFFALAKRFDINCVVVLTKADLLHPELLYDRPELINASPFVQEAIRNVSKHSGVPQNNIIPVKSYISQEDKVPRNNTDAIILDLIKKMIHDANETCMKHGINSHLPRNRDPPPYDSKELSALSA